MDADWDLQAVVRGCCSAVTSISATATTATAAATATVGPPDGGSQQKSTFSAGVFPDLFHPTSDNTIQQLMNNLYNYNRLRSQNLQPPVPPPTPPAAPPQSHPISAFSFLGGLQDPPLYNHNNHHHHYQKQQQQQEKQFRIKQQSLGVSRCTTAHAQSTTKIKKRKNQIKKVCQVPAEGSSPDLWSWRKYGQKPIKGSPYPRGYYKCSTLKGCSARKQVERNRSDPGMLIITYTGEHTHPVPTQLNSLSGTTRSKTTTTTATATAGDDGDTGSKPTPSPPVSPATTVPPATEKIDETERDDTDDDNNFDVSGLVIDEDAFDGLDEIVDGSVVGDVFSDHHAAATTASPPLPWLSSNWPPQPPPLPAGVEF